MDEDLEEEQDFQEKPREQADNLFQSKHGEPELQVHRIFKIEGYEACRKGFSKNQDVSSALGIRRLIEKVRIDTIKDRAAK